MRVSALLLMLAAVAASAREDPRWVRLRSANFELYTTAGEKRAREAILYFEQVRGFFVKAMSSKPATAGRVRIIAFSSDAEFKPYQPNQAAAAYATQDLDGDVIVMRGINEADYPIAVHEYTHTLIRPIGGRVPLWLNEGLADLYSTLRAAGRKVTVGTPIPGRLATLLQERWILLEPLLAADVHSPEYSDPKLAPAFYAESWALVHMLSLDEEYRANFSVFSKKVLAGTPTSEALRVVWGKDVMRVWKDLQRYARQSTWVYRIFDVPLEKSAEAPEVAPASRLETGVLLANLLWHSRKEEAAREYARLAAEFPDRPEVAEAAAEFALRQGRTEEAREQCARAVALGSRRAEVYRNYAALLGADEEHRAKRLELLAKALELNPSDNTARLDLALGLMNEERFEEAAAHLEKIGAVEPKDQFQYLHASAYAYYRLGRKEQALEMIERARPRASGGEVRMLDELERALKPPAQPRPAEVAERAATPVAAEKPEEPATEAEPAEPAAPKQPAAIAIEGVLDRLDCLGTKARVRVRVGGQPLYLLIDDPRVGNDMLACGPLKPRAVLVQYAPEVDRATTAAGMIRSIRYK